MLLRKTIDKAKNLFHKTLENLKSFVFGRYKKLTRAPSLNHFSTNINNLKMEHLDNFYREFCEHWESHGNKENTKNAVSDKGLATEESESKTVIDLEPKVLKNQEDNEEIDTLEELKPVVISSLEREKDVGCSKGVKRGCQSHVLEQKMKELEMMDVNDEDHVLDIEEVLHYYSHLTSPVYQDIVDKFFTDMYSEFFIPQPTAKNTSIHGSSRRLGPLNI